jgi:hypothetical protein
VLILYLECAQTHLCASVISKTFPGILPSDPLFTAGTRLEQEKRVEIKELNDHEEEKNRKG